MEKMTDILKSFLNKNDLDDKIGQYKIFNNWENLVGEKIAENAKPSKIVNNILYVKVENPSWKTELNLMRYDLLKNINKNSNNKFKSIKII